MKLSYIIGFTFFIALLIQFFISLIYYQAYAKNKTYDEVMPTEKKAEPLPKSTIPKEMLIPVKHKINLNTGDLNPMLDLPGAVDIDLWEGEATIGW